MAIGLLNKPNVDGVSTDYPFGNTRDKTVTIPGTKWDHVTMNDYIQFFEKIMFEAGIAPNGNFDNDTNGWQIYESFRKLTRPYKLYAIKIVQSGVTPPTVTPYFDDFTGITWAYMGAGIYKGTKTGAFIGKRSVLISPPTNGTTTFAVSLTDDEITVNTFEIDYSAGTSILSDNLLIQGYLEVKVFD